MHEMATETVTDNIDAHVFENTTSVASIQKRQLCSIPISLSW